MRSPARSPVGDLEGDVLLAEERLGQDRGGHVPRDVVELVRVEAQRELGAVAVGRRVEDLAHDHAADLDVRARGQLEADPVDVSSLTSS